LGGTVDALNDFAFAGGEAPLLLLLPLLVDNESIGLHTQE